MANNSAPLSRADVVSEVAAETSLPNSKVDEIIRAFERSVTRALVSGNEVRILGFGSFRTKENKARTGRNPQTGAPVKIAASRSVAFKTGSGLKEAVNAKKGAKGAKAPAAKAAPAKAAAKAPAKAAPAKAAPAAKAAAKAPAAKAATAKAAPAKAAPAKGKAAPPTKAAAAKGGKKGGKK